MTEVTLAQVLQSREDRVLHQQELLETHQCPLISFTMNIAGPVKNSPSIQRAFKVGLDALDKKLSDNFVRIRSIQQNLITGCEAMYAVDADALYLKKICAALEDTTPLGRLFDMDVLDRNGQRIRLPIPRSQSRNCIVCGSPGRFCAAGRVHSISQLQNATSTIIDAYFSHADAEKIADLAVQSLIDEVSTTPKPGLVDLHNNGSHADMDVSTFVTSARVLKPYFRECVTIGIRTAKSSASQAFSCLQQAGIKAETDMYRATGGVNTHKGIIYTMGILCGSIGRLWSTPVPVADTNRLLRECSNIAVFSPRPNSTLTAGQRAYVEYGLTGVRGEVAAGLPSVEKIGLPAYKKGLAKGLSVNHAGAVTLLHLMAHVSDTNLYHRGGPSGASYAANSARKLLECSNNPTPEEIQTLDDAFIARNLSPGGCADLLAVTYFLYTLENYCL